MVAAAGMRAIGRLLIPNLVGQGLGANAIIRQLRGMGMGYRRINMLADVREFAGLIRREVAARSTPVGEKPKPGVMVEMELKRPYKYRVFADVDYEDIETGAIQSQTVSFYTDELKPFDDWVEDYIADIEKEKYRPDVFVARMEIKGIEHAKGWEY